MSERRSTANISNKHNDLESQQIEQNVKNRIIQMVPLLASKNSKIEGIDHRTRDGHKVGIRKRDKYDVSGKRGFRVMVSLNKFLMWFAIIFVILPLFWSLFILSKRLVRGRKGKVVVSTTVEQNSYTAISDALNVLVSEEEIDLPVIEDEEEVVTDNIVNNEEPVDIQPGETPVIETPVVPVDNIENSVVDSTIEQKEQPESPISDTEIEKINVVTEEKDTEAVVSNKDTVTVVSNKDTTSSTDVVPVADTSEIIN